MKNKQAHLIISVLLSIAMMGQSFAQDKLTKIQYLNSFSNQAFNASALEQVRDAKVTDITTSPKGEFETTDMYEKRKTDSQRLAQEVRDEYASKINEAKRVFEKRQTAIKAEIQSFILSSREDVNSKITLGTYNADRQYFNITLGQDGKTYTVSVPLTSARSFKESTSNLKATGQRQLTSQGDWDYFNWGISVKGQSYYFGETKGASRQLASSTTENIVPPNLSVQVAFSEPSGDDRLDAEETAELIVTLKNKGEGPAFAVEILCTISGSSAIDYPKSAYMGEIPSGESRTKRLKFKASQNIASGPVTALLSFKESNNFEPNDQKISFETEALIPPRLEIVDIGIDDANGNSKIESNENVTLTVRLQNLGNGSADDVKVDIVKESPDIYFLGESQVSFNLGNLAPGEYKDISFEMTSNKKATSMPVSVTVTESRGRFGIGNHPLDLVFNQVQRGAKEMNIAGKYEDKGSFEATKGLSVDVEENVPVAKSQNDDALAIIFGIENYKNITNVTYAKRDAAITKEYFTQALGIPENRIYFQTDDNVSKAEFDKVFSKDGWLEKRMKKTTDVFVFYAGHGAPDIKENKAYLIPYDGDPNYASQTGFSMDKMYQELERLEANSVTVFLDACFSGANRESEMLLADARPVFIEVQGPSARGVTVFSASSSKEISSAYPKKKHGLFTYFMLKGLQGSADTNKDKKITVGELGDYIHANVSETAGSLDREQTPELQTINKNKVLVRY